MCSTESATNNGLGRECLPQGQLKRKVNLKLHNQEREEEHRAMGGGQCIQSLSSTPSYVLLCLVYRDSGLIPE